MYLAIDIILVVIMAAVIFKAAYRGFIVTLFSLLSTVASVLVAVLFYKELGAYFYDALVFENVAPYISDLAKQAIAEASGTVDVTALIAELPEGLRSAAELLGMDFGELAQRAAESAEVNTEAFSAMADNFAASLSQTISNVIAFAALFFGALILLNLVCFVLDKVAKLPILNGTNKLLGFAFGVLEALMLGIVLAHISATLCSAYGAMHTDFAFTQVAENTYVAGFLLAISPF